jgi:hypothetical protein
MTRRIGLISLISLFTQSFSRMKPPAGELISLISLFSHKVHSFSERFAESGTRRGRFRDLRKRRIGVDAGPVPEGSRERLAARSQTCNHSRSVKHTVLCHRKHLASQREPRVHALRLPLLILLALTSPALPQSNQPQDPAALVRRAIQNREDATRTHRPLRYLLRKTGDRRDTTKDLIETDQGYVARLIAVDNQPLTAEANQAELERLNTLANHPEIQEHRHQREQKDAARVNRMMRLLPDAFLYQDQGASPCPTGKGTCHHLSFTPNPNFNPPDVEAGIFRGLAGEVWIDQDQERLTRLDAHVIANVDFGWGILGKLDKGGTIQLEQSDIGNHDWELTSMKLNLQGKALMLKSLDIQLTEQATHFSDVPPGVDYRKAIQLLESASPAPTRRADP